MWPWKKCKSEPSPEAICWVQKTEQVNVGKAILLLKSDTGLLFESEMQGHAYYDVILKKVYTCVVTESFKKHGDKMLGYRCAYSPDRLKISHANWVSVELVSYTDFFVSVDYKVRL